MDLRRKIVSLSKPIMLNICCCDLVTHSSGDPPVVKHISIKYYTRQTIKLPNTDYKVVNHNRKAGSFFKLSKMVDTKHKGSE